MDYWLGLFSLERVAIFYEQNFWREEEFVMKHKEGSLFENPTKAFVSRRF